MSKQSEAKERQGYEARPVQQVCGKCKHLAVDMDWPKWIKDEPEKYASYMTDGNKQETNVRCGIGGFAVKKTATCREWRGANE